MATIERLKNRPDFLAAAAGRRFHTERMTAQGRLRGEGGAHGDAVGLRLGLTVTKRVGNSPERNRIKRRLRAAVARVAADLPAELATVPADIVLIARRPVLETAFDTLADDLRQAIPLVTRPGGERHRGQGPKKTGGGRAASSPSRRGGAEPAPNAIPNACGGVPDGQ